MKIPRFCLFVASCSLINAGVAAELVQTQAAIAPFFVQDGGTMVRNGSFTPFNYFDASLGILDAVVFEYTGSVNIVVKQVNPFTFPQSWTPSISVQQSFRFGLASPLEVQDMFGQQNNTGPLQQIPGWVFPSPLPAATPYSHEFTFTYSHTFDTPLDPFIGPPANTFQILDLTTVFTNVGYGDNGVGISGVKTLTYVYHPVPDAGGTAWLVLLSLGAIAGWRLKARE